MSYKGVPAAAANVVVSFSSATVVVVAAALRFGVSAATALGA